MILTTHSLAGAVIGKNIDNFWLIALTSLVLHYALDYLRHGEYLNRKSRWKDFWKVGLDLAIGTLIILAVVNFQNFPPTVIFNIWLGAFFSILPDFFTLLYWKLGMRFLKPLYKFHLWCHKYPPFAPERNWNFKNAINDIVVSMTAVILLFWF